MINLSAFCSSTNDDLAAPFNMGGHTYASDGYILVRVAERDEFAGNPIPENAQKKVPALLAGAAAIAFGPMPSMTGPSDHADCDTCSGRGMVEMCQRCGGSGTWTCGECDAEHTCKSCDEGVVPWSDLASDANRKPCDDCDGTGKDPDKLICAPCEGGFFKWSYWLMVASLPGVEVEQPIHNGRARPLLFRFIGGYACLMGMKPSVSDGDVIRPAQHIHP